MRKIIIILLFLSILSGCKKDEEVIEPEPSIYSFSFLKQNNPKLAKDIILNNSNGLLTGRVPFGVDISSLIANFEFIGSEVRIADQIQNSGTTKNDFTNIITYTVNNLDGSTKDYNVDITWFTGLPVIKIFTFDGEDIVSKEDYVEGKAYINGGRTFDDGSGDMKIRGRGHSTWGLHPKKPYQLKFDDKTEMLDMPKDKKWIFLAEHSDKTLMRNKLAFEMGYISNLDWTPLSQYAEVFINDEYNGTYNICQKVEAGDNRVAIGSEGYLLEIDTPDHLAPDDIFFNSTKFTIQIKEPEIATGSSEFNYIKNHIIEFEQNLYSSNFSDPEDGYMKYIDIESFIDWYLINEIAKNQDARSYSSIYLNVVPGEKIKMGPLWDFDLGFGNVDYSECEYPTGFWVKDHAWYSRLFEDPAFVSKVKDRFTYFITNEDYFMQIIDNNAEYLRLAQEENNNKWDIYGNYIWPNPVVYNTHVEEVNHLKTWLTTRINWLDSEINNL